MNSHFAEPLRPLVVAWQRAVRGPRRRAAATFFVFVGAVALLYARHGTMEARSVVLLVLLAEVAALIGASVWERRAWTDPCRMIRRLAERVEPERAARALRALTLVQAPDAGTSPELARLHVARTLVALPRHRVLFRASQLGFRFRLVGAVFASALILLSLVSPWAVLEGADIMAAHRGVAPITMQWVDDLGIDTRPPEYLHLEQRQRRSLGEMTLPYGTLVTFLGKPTHTGRKLLLTDGESEVPFVEDGSGNVLARWPLTESVTLRVVARFGDVIIEGHEALAITSVADRAPEVKLEGAPRSILLAKAEGDIPIRYEVTDDHGLREVQLVLRSASREERRVLARLDGEIRVDRGGHVLRASDPFLRRSHAPIEVRVEAKDNDPITGPKWGASEAITIVPPNVGEPEAFRLNALRKLRDVSVDTLAWRLSHDVSDDPEANRVFLSEERRGANEVADALDRTLTGSFAAVYIPRRLQAILRGQFRKVQEVLGAETRAPVGSTHALVVKASERFVLVLDAVIRGLGQHDARQAARELAEVADDLALGAMQLQMAVGEHPLAPTAIDEPSRPVDAGTHEVDRGGARMDASALVLEGGARSMKDLGVLGRDIGEIIAADLARVGRGRKESDFFHAELAARDLSARLRQPDPSFGAQGGSAHAGGESGGSHGTQADRNQEDDAERAFNEAAQELERLAQDHAGQIGKIEQALNSASDGEELKALLEDAKKHASAVRDATRNLPSVGGGSDSWTSKGAAAREHAEQMARSLEQANPGDAVASGRNAIAALEEAKRFVGRDRWGDFVASGSDAAAQRLEEAQRKLEPELKWAESKLEMLRKRAAERASSDLVAGSAEEDKMADRAQRLAQKGEGQGALPAPALESLAGAEQRAREAAQSLRRGEADKGLEHQREAQRLLEMAREALGSEGDDDRGTGSDGNTSLDHADIPKADAHKGPEEFRRRVIRGLGQPASGREKDAVRRYAEGLLR